MNTPTPCGARPNLDTAAAILGRGHETRGSGVPKETKECTGPPPNPPAGQIQKKESTLPEPHRIRFLRQKRRVYMPVAAPRVIKGAHFTRIIM